MSYHSKRGAERLLITFGSVDPNKGKMGARQARKLIVEYGVKGIKFHPTAQGFVTNGRMAYTLDEVIAEYKLPMLFHSGHSGIGTEYVVQMLGLDRA